MVFHKFLISEYKLAKGNYVFWIDSDDYIKENIIEKLYENLIKM